VREIHFYRTQSGYCPVEEFLDSLSGKSAQKIAWVLQLVEELNTVPVTYLKKLVNTENLWEVRVQIGGSAFRLLGFFAGENVLILNHAFQKKTQKIAAKHIKLAESRKRDYINGSQKS